jgi:hypothetical protein
MGGAPGMGGGAPGSPGTAGATGTAGTTGTELWIGPNGADSNPGTQASPFLTLTAAHARATAGATIWVLPGNYRYSATASLSKNGTATQPINIFAAAGARPVLDFSGQPRDTSSARGIQINGDYWHIKGLEIENAGDNCVWIGGSHNTMEQLVIHGCDDTGVQITASVATDPTRGAFNTILNVDSYENFDGATGGENADGFAAKLHIGPGNVFQGCRSWNNADDGWDLFAANDVVVITGCWSFLNGKTLGGESNPAGDGNGFKLGGAPTPGDPDSGGAVHLVTGSFAFENLSCGFVQNNNPDVPSLNMCGSARNRTAYCQTLNQSNAMNNFTMTGADAKAAPRNADGSLPAIH